MGMEKVWGRGGSKRTSARASRVQSLREKLKYPGDRIPPWLMPFEMLNNVNSMLPHSTEFVAVYTIHIQIIQI